MGKALRDRIKQAKFDSIEQEASLNLIVSGNFMRTKFDKLCQEFGITGAQYNILRILKGIYPKEYTRGDILSRMIDPSADVTRLIDRLTKQKLVERYNGSEDRRNSYARITKKGLNLIDKVSPKVKVFNKMLGDVLTKEEAKTLSEICEKIYSSET